MSSGSIDANGGFDPKDVCKRDPFAGIIESALLNSVDINAYATTLVPPLLSDYDKSGLKPATYEVKFEGDVYWWEHTKTLLDRISPFTEEKSFETSLKHQRLGADDDFEIPPNSIVFVVPKTYFRVPPFLALRFNLHINLVHRGLLLGTGPLVDPGFAGSLMIPVHNLTSQPVIVRGDRGFIWIEITKLSRVRYGGKPVEFPREKNARTVKQYFYSANGLRPIVSTLLITAERLQDLAKWGRTISIYATIFFLISLISVLYGGWSLLNDAHGYVTSAKDDVAKALSDLNEEKKIVRKMLGDVSSERASLQVELSELKRRESELQKKLVSSETTK